MLTLEKFEEAYDVVKRVAKETKLLYSKRRQQQVGNKVYFKPENLQHTGAYKIRGAYYKISTLTPEERAKIRSKTFPGIAKAMAEQWASEAL